MYFLVGALMIKAVQLWWQKHYQSILVFLGLFLMISPIILSKPLNNLDEIWIYNFAKNMADGLIPYRDFNMITTPLLPMISGSFLDIFGNELIIMRILAIFLCTFILFFAFKILNKLKIPFIYNLFFVFLLFLLLQDYFCIDYNFGVLLITLILIYLELNYYEKNKYYFSKKYLFHFLIGILSSCCILMKQSTGFFIALISIIYPIFFVKNKIDFKNYLKIFFIRILGILITIIFLVNYLFINNSFYTFIDYCILGIKTFSNSIPYSNLINSNNLIIKLLSIFIPIFILIAGIYLLKKKEKKLFCFYLYIIVSLIVIFPISDTIHFLIGITPFLILFYYLFFQFLLYLFNKIKNRYHLKNKNNLNNINKFKINNKNYLKNNNIKIENLNNNLKISNRSDNVNGFQKSNNGIFHNKIIKIKLFILELLKAFIALSLIIYLITSIILLNNYFNDNLKKHSFNHYQYIPINSQLVEKINLIDNYILSEQNPVYILDAEAAIYMISLDKYSKNFDMFLKGNIGSKGEEGIIEEIGHFNSGTKILIKKDESKMNWQTPMTVIHFIQNNFNKIGEISIFDIYEIP